MSAPPVTLRNGSPVEILGACKRAALKADWLLSQWVEFSTTARACLTADCEPEEMSKFLDVVRERFAVTLVDGFRLDVPTRQHEEHAHDGV